MRKIVAKIILFLLSLIIIDQCIGFLFERFIFSKTYAGEAGGNVNYLFKTGRSRDYIILGSSRAKNMINPDSLISFNGIGYNAGINGVGGIMYINTLVDLMIQKKIIPKYIILQTDAREYEIKKNSINLNQISPLYPFIDESSVLKSYCKTLGPEEQLKLYSKLYRYNGKIYNVFINYFNKSSTKYRNGYTPLKGTIEKSRISIKRNDINNSEVILPDFDSSRLAALQNVLHVCIENKIRVFVLFPPSFNNSMYNKSVNDKLVDFIKNNYNAEVINMADISNFTNIQDPSKWKDAAHLNRAGADLFSSYLNDSLSVRLGSGITPH